MFDVRCQNSLSSIQYLEFFDAGKAYKTVAPGRVWEFVQARGKYKGSSRFSQLILPGDVQSGISGDTG